jgi:hypothetical protein
MKFLRDENFSSNRSICAFSERILLNRVSSLLNSSVKHEHEFSVSLFRDECVTDNIAWKGNSV